MIISQSYVANFHSIKHLIKQVEFIRKRVQKMSKVKDICNVFNNLKEADSPTLVAGATDDVPQSELLIVWHYHVTYEFQSKSTLYRLPELLAPSRRHI